MTKNMEENKSNLYQMSTEVFAVKNSLFVYHPDPKWQLHPFDGLIVNMEKAPNWWWRMWLYVFFGWKWKKINK